VAVVTVSNTIGLHRRVISTDAAAVEDELEARAAQEAAVFTGDALAKTAKTADQSDSTPK
jgi:hypothetical protein